MAFFPGLMLEFQWGFIKDYSWFAITLVTTASFFDTLGRTIGAKYEWIPKDYYLLSSVLRGALFAGMCLLTYYGVAPGLFRADWFLVLGLALFAGTCGYWTALGMKYGSDEETVDRGTAGVIMGFHLTLGLSLGSLVAWLAFS